MGSLRLRPASDAIALVSGLLDAGNGNNKFGRRLMLLGATGMCCGGLGCGPKGLRAGPQRREREASNQPIAEVTA